MEEPPLEYDELQRLCEETKNIFGDSIDCEGDEFAIAAYLEEHGIIEAPNGITSGEYYLLEEPGSLIPGPLLHGELKDLCKETRAIYGDEIDCRGGSSSLGNYLLDRGVVEEREGEYYQIAKPGQGEIASPSVIRVPSSGPRSSSSTKSTSSSGSSGPSPVKEVPISTTTPPRSMKKSSNQINEEELLVGENYEPSQGFYDEPITYYGKKKKKLGKGAYGSVSLYSGPNGDFAIKRIKEQYYEADGIGASTIRELAVLNRLDHIRIVSVYDYYIKINEVEFVMPIATGDLHSLIESRTLTDDQRKLYSYQLLSAFAYLQAKDVLHRDLKPQNVLVFADDSIKVTDFGLARPAGCLYSKGMTKMVYTLWYRPIELLAEDLDVYHLSADMWSVACVLYELYTGYVLFRGDNEQQVINRIFSILGYNADELGKLGSTYIDEFARPRAGWKRNTSAFDAIKEPEVRKMVLELLNYDPMERPMAYELLTRSFFDNVRNRDEETSPVSCPDTFLVRQWAWGKTERTDHTEESLQILLDWVLGVNEILKNGEVHLSTRSYFVAVFLLDWALQLLPVQKEELQLLGAACHHLATKYTEVYAPTNADYLAIMNNTYTNEQLLNMESKILEATNLDFVFTVSYDLFAVNFEMSNDSAEAETVLLLLYGMTFSQLRFELLPEQQFEFAQRVALAIIEGSSLEEPELKQFEQYRNDLHSLNTNELIENPFITSLSDRSLFDLIDGL